MLQEFHKNGGDTNAPPTRYTTPPDRRSHFSSGRKCSEHCPRCAARLGRKYVLFGAYPVPHFTFLWGLPPPGYPAPSAFAFFPFHAIPAHVPCALVHAAAWHSGGWTPLMFAADRGHTDALALLLQLGAAVDAQDSHG